MATGQAKQHYSWSQLVSDLAEGARRSYQFLKDNKKGQTLLKSARFPSRDRNWGAAKASKHSNHLWKVQLFGWGFQIHQFVGDWVVTYHMGRFSVCSGQHPLILLFVNVLGITKRSSYIQNFGINFFFECTLHHKGCKLSCWGTEMALDQYV